MEAKTELEYRELLNLDNRTITLCYALRAYLDTPAAIKGLIKVADVERKNVKNSKAPLGKADLNTVVWRYDDICKIARDLRKTKDASIFGKACSDLDSVIEKVEAEVDELRRLLSDEEQEQSVKTFADKVATGARAVGEKIKGAFSDAAEKIKKLAETDAK